MLILYVHEHQKPNVGPTVENVSVLSLFMKRIAHGWAGIVPAFAFLQEAVGNNKILVSAT
jgi:hypothetical protein